MGLGDRLEMGGCDVAEAEGGQAEEESCCGAIFEVLEFSNSPWDLLRDVIVANVPIGMHETVKVNALGNLFNFRIHPVHEIASGTVGSHVERCLPIISRRVHIGSAIPAWLSANVVSITAAPSADSGSDLGCDWPPMIRLSRSH
jgi:hypothetical protein